MKQNSKISLNLGIHLMLLALAVLVFLATFYMPMLSTPGFESANLYVLIMGPLLALAGASRERGRSPDFSLILKRELAWLALLLSLIFGLLYIRSFFVSSCSAGFGVGAFFLILIPPLLLNTVIGSMISRALARLSFKFLLWFLFYATYCAFKLHFWWHDSLFRFLSDISLIITSDLLEGGEITPVVIAFRLGTLGFACALIALALCLWPKSRAQRSFYFVLFLILSSGAMLLHTRSLSDVGKNKQELIQDYSLKQTADNISVYANANFTSVSEAQAILNEALFYQERLGKKLGTLSLKPLIIWLHHDDDQKALYTGAKNVHFAQPKQREIHIAQSHIPHPVLGHELAHIYVGEYAKTLWGLPGRWFVVPNMALTEGLAMVLTPELAVANNLDLMQQAQALEQAHRGVNIKTLFSMNPLDFSRNDFRAAYIFSGAFLNFYLENSAEHDRAFALQKIAQAGSLGALFKSPEELTAYLKRFSSRLGEPVPTYALLWARQNFGHTGILTADCTVHKTEPIIKFKQALLNLEISSAIKELDNFKSVEKIDLFLSSIKLLLQKKQNAQALELIGATKNLLKESGDPRLSEAYLYELQALIQEKRFTDAFELIKNIDAQALNPSAHRQILIQNELLSELNHSIDMNYKQLLHALVFMLNALGLDKTAELQFGMALGKYSGPETLLVKFARYVYARLLMRAQEYQEALVLIHDILTPNILLPSIILEEAWAMKAACLMAEKNYQEALNIYSYLLTQALTPSAGLIYSDKLERVKFYEAHKL